MLAEKARATVVVRCEFVQLLADGSRRRCRQKAEVALSMLEGIHDVCLRHERLVRGACRYSPGQLGFRGSI